jgi:hypothetical protein
MFQPKCLKFKREIAAISLMMAILIEKEENKNKPPKDKPIK